MPLVNLGDISGAAFAAGVAAADERLARYGPSPAVLDGKGLALCGLCLCEDERHMAAAGNAFVAARKMTRAKGVVASLLKQFDALAVADTRGLLAPVRSVAEGASWPADLR